MTSNRASHRPGDGRRTGVGALARKVSTPRVDPQRQDAAALKLVVTTVDLPEQPQYAISLHWDVTTAVDDKTFTFVPPTGAQKIEFAAAIAAK